MADEHRSPLFDAQVAAGGGEPYLEDGWPWFMNFGDAVGEFRAIRTATGLWDLFSAIKYEVTGPGRHAADPAPVHERPVGRDGRGASATAPS